MTAPDRKLKYSKAASLALFIQFILFSLVADLFAGTISIQLDTRIETEGDRLGVHITCKNNGDAEARRLRSILSFPWGESTQELCGRLEAGESVSALRHEKIRIKKAGSYPVKIMVAFKDSRGYPFSALSALVFPYRGEGEGGIVFEASDLDLEQQGLLHCSLENMTDSKKEVKVRLHLPEEIKTDLNDVRVDIEKGEKRGLEFRLWNLTALGGATYPVFCLCEYESEDRHFSLVSRSKIFIEEYENIFRRNRSVWISLFLLFFALTVLEFLRSCRKKR